MSDWEKVNCCAGITSRVPGTEFHYLIIDIDGKHLPVLNEFCEGARAYKTKHGFHIYTPAIFCNLRSMLSIATRLGADPTWARLATRRGYAFLRTKIPIDLPWPIEYMTLTRKTRGKRRP